MYMNGQISHVLNVIAADGTRSEDVVAQARALADLFSSYGEISWLSPGKAFDVGITIPEGEVVASDGGVPDTDGEGAPAGTDAGDGEPVLTEEEIADDYLMRTVRAARGKAEEAGLVADINMVALRDRRKKLLVADMDSTIITCECLDEIAGFAGLKDEIAAMTEQAMRGKMPFSESLHRRVSMLKGVPVATLEKVWHERIYLTRGARDLIGTMKANGARCLLVSGGFTFFTSRVAKACGFDYAVANRLMDDGEVLTGEVAEPILDRRAKYATMLMEAERMGLEFHQTMAVGDGANDLAMIKRAGIGVAFHAKPLVSRAARVRINHNKLRALLYLQGYRDSEIVTGATTPA